MGYLSENIRASLDRASGTPAVQFKGSWMSWREIRDIADGLDRYLTQLGLGAGAAVGCALRNWPVHLATLIELAASERCLVSLNALTPDDKLAADVMAARPAALIAAAADWEREALRSAAKSIAAAGISLTGNAAQPVKFVEGLEKIGPGPHQEPLPDVAVLMLTSGTTGAPKRVPLMRAVLDRQLIEATGGLRHDGSGEKAPLVADGISIMHGSVVHIGGVWSVLGAAAAGRPICLLEKFNVAEWRQAIVEHRPKAASAPPAALRMILDANVPKEDLASVASIGTGTAPLDPAIVDEFLARYDIPVLSTYGATEFAGGVASWSLRAFRQSWARKRGAVGRVHKSIEARVVDSETGAVLPFGEEGVLELKGYAAGDGKSWIRTTDRAVLDADRFLWIRGRSDNAINRGGFKVQPDDVIKVLEQHPAIREAVVIGIPDARLGEVPVAALLLRTGASPPSDAELSNWVRARLLAYCVPVAFKILDDLPRTPSMKASAPALRELFAPR